jgi:hypothetical protein
MGLQKSRLFERLILLQIALSRWLCRRNISDFNNAITSEAKERLLEKAIKECAYLDVSHLNVDIVTALFSPESMLQHPLLMHFIRPASRMALNLGYKVNGVPIVSSPNLRFAGRTSMLDEQNLKIAEIPLGSILLLRELASAILNLHNAIAYGESEKVQFFARVCRFLSALLCKPAPYAFHLSQASFASMPISYTLYSSQVYNVLGVFLILHELGHICLRHNLDPISDQQSCAQELAADVFAMEGLFSPKKDNPRYEPFRKMQMIYICHMLSIFEIGYTDMGIKLDGYPSFASRREALLTHFQSGTDVISSVNEFNVAIAVLPPPTLDGLQW